MEFLFLQFSVNFVLFSSESHWMDPGMKINITLWKLLLIGNNFRWSGNHKGLFIFYFPNSSQLLWQTTSDLISIVFFVRITDAFFISSFAKICWLWGIFCVLMFFLWLFLIFACRFLFEDLFPLSNSWMAFFW